MKIKHLFLSLLAVATVAATGCKKEELSDPSLKLNPSSLEFGAAAGTQKVLVDANQAWDIEEIDEDWIALSEESGKGATTIEVTVKANTGLTRTAKIVFHCSIKKKTLKITQTGEGKVETITVKEFIEKADTENEYTLSGTVSGFSSQYCSFDLTDETGKIYVYSVTDASKAEYKDKIANGGKVVLSGKYKYYENKSQHEVVEATIISYEPGEAQDYSKAEAKSVAEFIKLAEEDTYYKLTGKVSNFNSTYLNFYLTDDTGSIYVYGASNPNKLTIADGGTVTVAGPYKNHEGINECLNPVILSFEAGEVETGKVTGVAVAVSTNGFLLKTEADENNGLVYAFDSKYKHTVKVGDKVTVEGTKTTYNDVPEITGYDESKITVISSGNTVTHPDATEITKDNIASYNNLFGYVKTTGKLSISGTHYNIVIDGATVKGTLSYPVTEMVPSTLNNKNLDVTGYFVGISGTSDKYFNILVTDVKESAVQPEPEPDPEIKDGKLTLVIDDVKAKFTAATIENENDGFTATISGFTIKFWKASGSTKPVAPTDLLKLYKGHALTISSTEKKIKGVEFTCSETKYCVDITVNSASDTVVKASGTTLTWTGTAVNEFKCTAAAGQCRFNKIVITVE